MIPAPVPADEPQRLAALRAYGVLDTPSEPGFDDIVHLAAHLCGAPIALITLVDEQRQWFKARVGVAAQLTKTSREISFCAHAVAERRDVMVVPDTLADERFATNPLVSGDPNIRFYAGALLVGREGQPLGTLCVLDIVPRQLSPEQLTALRALRRSVIQELESRRYARELQAAKDELESRVRDRTLELATTMQREQEARRAAEESRAQMVQILERVTDGFVALDRQWKYTYVNARAGEMFQRRPQDLIGKHIWTEFPEGMGQPFHLAYERAMAEQVPRQIEDYYPPWDRWFENRIYPSPEGVSIFFQDITERILAQRALQESEARYRTLVEQAADGILIADAEGRLLEVNTAGRQMFGYEDREMLGLNFTDLVAESEKDGVMRVVEELRRGRTCLRERLLRREDGRIIPGETKAKMLPDGRLLAIVRDISERKRSEQELRTLSRRLLAAQEEERGRIARELHDEIGQVLTAVKLTVERLARSPDDEARRRERLAGAIATVDKAIERTRNLSLDLRPSLLDDLGLAAAVRWFLQRQTEDSDIAAEVSDEGLDARLPEEVETAAFRVVQEAVTNTLRHAHARRLRVHLRAHGEALEVSVLDDGQGFDSAAAHERAAAGLSAGLSGMSERVALAGGTVEVRSQPGTGTEVMVRFPLHREVLP